MFKLFVVSASNTDAILVSIMENWVLIRLPCRRSELIVFHSQNYLKFFRDMLFKMGSFPSWHFFKNMLSKMGYSHRDIQDSVQFCKDMLSKIDFKLFEDMLGKIV